MADAAELTGVGVEPVLQGSIHGVVGSYDIAGTQGSRIAHQK
jgi:hypothetical protein